MSKGKRQKAKGKSPIQKSKFSTGSTLLNFALYFCLLTFDFCLSTALACPGCSESLFEPGKVAQNLSTARGYALSIALLLGVPVALLGAIAGLVVRARRKAMRDVRG